VFSKHRLKCVILIHYVLQISQALHKKLVHTEDQRAVGMSSRQSFSFARMLGLMIQGWNASFYNDRSDSVYYMIFGLLVR
jgi:hypothetical protein